MSSDTSSEFRFKIGVEFRLDMSCVAPALNYDLDGSGIFPNL
jgi:hypothetical protein